MHTTQTAPSALVNEDNRLYPTLPSTSAAPSAPPQMLLNNNSVADSVAVDNNAGENTQGGRSDRRHRRRHHRHGHSRGRSHSHDQIQEHADHERHHHRRHHKRSTPRPSKEHVMNQVDKILGSVASGNIVGIVDESLKIRTSEPVRNLVTGIMSTIFHPLDRLMGRGSANKPLPSQSTGISGNAT